MDCVQRPDQSTVPYENSAWTLQAFLCPYLKIMWVAGLFFLFFIGELLVFLMRCDAFSTNTNTAFSFWAYSDISLYELQMLHVS